MSCISTFHLSGSPSGRSGRRILSSLACLCLAGSCSDKDSITIIEAGASGEQVASASAGSGGEGEGGAAGMSTAGSGGTAGPETGSSDDESLYIVNTTVDSPEGRLAYFIVTPSIEGDVEIDVKKGLEIAGNARAYSLPGVPNAFLASGGESPTFTRYDVQDDQSLVIGDSMSFANFGVQNPNGQMKFVSPTKAYYFDNSQLQVISFNPESLEAIQAISVKPWECPDGLFTSFGTVLQRDGGFYFPRDCGLESGVGASGVSLAFLNSDTDEITISEDSRCMALSEGLVAESGTAYWFSDPDATSYWAFERQDAPHDCGLRILAEETTFDLNWELDFTSLSGGVSVIATVAAGNFKFWVKVFDESIVNEPIPVDEIDWDLKAWRWALLDIESDTPIEFVQNAPPVVAYGPGIRVDERAFSFSINADFTETTLVEMSEGGFQNRLRVQGELRKIIKIR